MPKSKKSKQNVQGAGKAEAKKMMKIHPPQFLANPVVPMKLRFSVANSSATGITVTPFTICQAGGMMAVTTSTQYPLATAVKVSRVRLWASATGAGSNGATASIQWAGSGGNFGSNFDVSDTSLSQAYPAHVDSRPPARSLAADWSVGTNTGTLFQIAISSNTEVLIDVDAVFVLNDGTAGTVVTASGASVGTVYYAPLDGRGGVLLPVSKTVAT